MTHIRAFTLIEVLLATALLAFGVTLAMATLRSTGRSVHAGEIEAERTERVRVVQQFLRRQLMAARTAVLAQDPETFTVTLFEGERERLRLVAPLPGWLARGGDYAQTLRLARGEPDEGDRLEFEAQMLLAGKPIEETDPRPPVPLLEGIERLEFSYRGIDSNGSLGRWMSRWEFSDRLPLQVRIEVDFVDPAVRWPPFTVALPMAIAQGASSMVLDPGIGQPNPGEDAEEVDLPEADDEERKP